jgi:hypothetical protein
MMLENETLLATVSNKVVVGEVLAVKLWRLWYDEGVIGQSSALGLLLIIVLGALTIFGRWLVARASRQE